jgi:ubiquinone/menaquinone biosynthesis C-methylase UbiE
MWRIWHWLIRKVDANGATTFLNYGYAGKSGEFDHLILEGEYEYHRYAIQLYCHTTRNHRFPGTHVLEVGCGRGGGAAFLAQTFKPSSYIGLDINSGTTAFCNRRHKVEGLRFITGDAENLPFANNLFDAVVNVESARCYPDIMRFFEEVFRVLKPGGKFLFADMIKPDDLEEMELRLASTGFKFQDKKDIRLNVLAALQSDSKNRKAEIDSKVPAFLRSSFYEFAGVEGSNRFNIFKSGEMGYWTFTLLKK